MGFDYLFDDAQSEAGAILTCRIAGFEDVITLGCRGSKATILDADSKATILDVKSMV